MIPAERKREVLTDHRQHETDTGSPEVQRIMEDVPKRLEGTGLAAGTTLVKVDEIQQKLAWGYRFMNVGNVVSYGCEVLCQNLATPRAAPKGNKAA